MAPVVIAGIISAGASLLGGLFGKKAQKDSDKAQAKLAKEQMEFAERDREDRQAFNQQVMKWAMTLVVIVIIGVVIFNLTKKSA